MNANNGVKWKRFTMPKKVEHINDYLFIDGRHLPSTSLS